MTPVGAWQVLAAETFLARSCLDQMTTRLTTPLRAAILADLAVTADALATGTEDLALAAGLPAQDAVRGRARELAAAASQVQIETAAARQADSAPVPPVPAAREPRRVQIVREHADMPAALANLGRLMVTGRPSAAELFATTIMLSTTADAVATALDVAARSSRVPDPEGLAAAAETLTDYRRELTTLLREHQTKIASLGPGNPAALAQARELRTAGVPRLHALATDANRAAASAGELQRIAANLAPATASVRAGFAALDTRSGMLAYAWAPGPGFYWRAATDSRC